MCVFVCVCFVMYWLVKVWFFNMLLCLCLCFFKCGCVYMCLCNVWFCVYVSF